MEVKPNTNKFENKFEKHEEKQGSLKIGTQEFSVRIRDSKTAQLTAAHNRANENQPPRRNRNIRREGAVTLRNTDSIGRANRVRSRLRAKIGEIMSSNIEPDIKKSLARNVQMQLERVENTIRQIRRRERAEQEERREQRQEVTRQRERRQEKTRAERVEERRREEARRRRRNDMRERSTRIRRDFLYPARQGGFNPYDFASNRNGNFNDNNSGFTIDVPPAVAFDVGGTSGVADIPSPAQADFDLNITL